MRTNATVTDTAITAVLRVCDAVSDASAALTMTTTAAGIVNSRINVQPTARDAMKMVAAREPSRVFAATARPTIVSTVATTT